MVFQGFNIRDNNDKKEQRYITFFTMEIMSFRKLYLLIQQFIKGDTALFNGNLIVNLKFVNLYTTTFIENSPASLSYYNGNSELEKSLYCNL